ncbi:MAG: Hsp20/alpha crystallin family protein [Anaerolineae bacterium]|jgi:HSP20 family protein
MTVMRFNSLTDAMSLREAMDRLLEESLVRSEPSGRRGSVDNPFRLPIDVYRTPEEIVVVASLPGLLPEEVDITLEGDTLTIRGELRPPLDNVEYLFQERPFGYFSRSLTLNVPVDVENIDAIFENGVLSMSIPKSEEVKPKPIKIKTK